MNVGPSADGTRDLVASLGDPRIRLLDGAWDPAQGGRMLAVETQRALDACRGCWAIYIQADEVLHQSGSRGAQRGHGRGRGRSPGRGAAGRLPALLRQHRLGRGRTSLVSARGPGGAPRRRNPESRRCPGLPHRCRRPPTAGPPERGHLFPLRLGSPPRRPRRQARRGQPDVLRRRAPPRRDRRAAAVGGGPRPVHRHPPRGHGGLDRRAPRPACRPASRRDPGTPAG